MAYGVTNTRTIISRLTKRMNSSQGVALDAARDPFVATNAESELLEYIGFARSEFFHTLMKAYTCLP